MAVKAMINNNKKLINKVEADSKLRQSCKTKRSLKIVNSLEPLTTLTKRSIRNACQSSEATPKIVDLMLTAWHQNIQKDMYKGT